MTKPTFTLAVIVLVIAMIPMMIALKIIDRNRSILVGAEGYPKTAHAYRLAIREGILRRLDNPSFWNLIATAVAGGCILRAIKSIGTNATWPKYKHYWAWIGWATVLVGAMLADIHHNSETFFAYRRRDIDETILIIQVIEGIAFSIVIVAGTALLAVALTCVDVLLARCKMAQRAQDLADILEPAGELADAGLGVGIAATWAVFFWTLVSKFTGEKPSVAGTADLIWVVALEAAMWLPFLYLYFQIRHKPRKWLEFGRPDARNVDMWFTFFLSPFIGSIPKSLKHKVRVRDDAFNQDSGSAESDIPPT